MSKKLSRRFTDLLVDVGKIDKATTGTIKSDEDFRENVIRIVDDVSDEELRDYIFIGDRAQRIIRVIKHEIKNEKIDNIVALKGAEYFEILNKLLQRVYMQFFNKIIAETVWCGANIVTDVSEIGTYYVKLVGKIPQIAQILRDNSAAIGVARLFETVATIYFTKKIGEITIEIVKSKIRKNSVILHVKMIKQMDESEEPNVSDTSESSDLSNSSDSSDDESVENNEVNESYETPSSDSSDEDSDEDSDESSDEDSSSDDEQGDENSENEKIESENLKNSEVEKIEGENLKKSEVEKSEVDKIEENDNEIVGHFVIKHPEHKTKRVHRL